MGSLLYILFSVLNLSAVRSGLESYWLGGPSRDGDGTLTGGFVYSDISALVEGDGAGLERKAWLVSAVLGPTSAAGRCAAFSYVTQGLNVEALRFKPRMLI